MSRRFKPAREFFTPKGAIKLTFKDNDAVVYVYETAGTPYALGFAGKRNKPDFHYRYSTSQRREEAIKRYVDARRAEVARKAELAATRKGFAHGYKVGDMLAYSWGYDQTNVDFFQVIATTKATVTIREISGKLSTNEGGSSMSGRVTAVKDSFREKAQPMVKRVQHQENGPGYISMDHGSASLTDETRSHYCSWYA